jgi:copper oxidase (laccase) domain-containing protein
MSSETVPLFERFAALSELPDCRHVFTRRIPGIDVSHDKAEALRRLDTVHHEIRRSIGLENLPLLTTEQVHGDKIEIIDRPIKSDRHLAGRDGFITNQCGIALGIYVADCCAVYIVDPIAHVLGLVHSGKKGTELAIAAKAIEQMAARFESNPTNMIVQLSPCIRPPHYEIDFAAQIVEQCRAQGVNQIYNSDACTACHPDLYYSYRTEKGRTGRMLALLGFR